MCIMNWFCNEEMILFDINYRKIINDFCVLVICFFMRMWVWKLNCLNLEYVVYVLFLFVWFCVLFVSCNEFGIFVLGGIIVYLKIIKFVNCR